MKKLHQSNKKDVILSVKITDILSVMSQREMRIDIDTDNNKEADWDKYDVVKRKLERKNMTQNRLTLFYYIETPRRYKYF